MQADEPGTYFGQCAEFCGLQHAMMKVRVVALSPSDWEAWVANQKLAAVDARRIPLAREGHGSVHEPAVRRPRLVHGVPLDRRDQLAA